MLKQIILIIYRPIFLLQGLVKKMIVRRKWGRYGKTLRYPLSDSCLLNLDTQKTYLVLAPHSDDEWIGCSRVLISCPKSYVCYMDMPGGDNDEVHQKRYEEIKKGVENNGRQLYKVGDDKIESLQEIVASVRPDFVLVPYYFDWHEEHIAVMQLLKQALTESSYECKILMYQVSVPIPVKACNLCVPMSKIEQNDKWSFFHDTYKTQTFMPVKRFMAYEKMAGGLVGAYSAEVYVIANSEVWIRFLDANILRKEMRDTLQKRLSDMGFIYEQVNLLYNETK